MNSKDSATSLWTKIVEGLKEKPAYLLIFAIVALFFLSGLSTAVIGSVRDNNTAIIVGAVVATAGLGAACYVIRIVEEPSYKTYYKTQSIRKRWATGVVIDPQKVEAKAEEMLRKLIIEGDLSLGLSYKDPTSKIVMTHTAVGDYGERDRMSDIMASFITAKKTSVRLDFNKIVIPKSGNVIFSIKVAEKLGVDVVAFRGKDHAIAEDQHLEFKKNYFDGNLEDKDSVIIVDDVTFRGNTIMQTLEWLKNAGVEIKAVFVLAAHAQYIDNIRAVLATSYPTTSFYAIITI